MDFDQITETITPTASTSLTIGSTGALFIPSGTTAQRPGSPDSGYIRFNTSNTVLEYYNGVAVQWQTFGSSSMNNLNNVAGTGMLTQTSSGVYAARTITGTASRLTVTNGDGVAGNPTLDISTAYVGQATITTLGTVATGTWNATTISAIRGGTGQIIYAVGDILYANATTTLAKLSVGSNGQVLTLAAGIPSWATPASGGVTTVSAGSTGLTPNTPTAGAITLAGTLIAVNGGTGQNTYAVGDLLQGAAANTLAKLPAVATGNVLISGGVTTASSWGKVGLTTHVTGILPLANGGSNANLTAVNGAVAYSSASAIALTAAGTSGQVLISNGAAAPTWTTLASTSASKVMNTWTLLSGNLYFNDFTHNLNTTLVSIYLRETSNNQEVRGQYTEIISANIVRLVVNGNAQNITMNVVSGQGAVGPQGATGAGSNVLVQNQGSPLATAGDTLNFTGAGVVASGVGTTKTITIAGGGGATVPTINQTGTGTVVTGTVAANALGFGAAMYMANTGQFSLTNATLVAAGSSCRALALETGTGAKQILLTGFIRNDSWTWTPGLSLYLSTTNGVLTHTAPNSPSNRVQKVGFAWSSTIIYFSPGDYTIVEVA